MNLAPRRIVASHMLDLFLEPVNGTISSTFLARPLLKTRYRRTE